MKRVLKSLGYALQGAEKAWDEERNIRLFVPCYIVVLCFGAWLRLLDWEWIAVLLSGCGFLAIELLNTSIERLTDVLDDHHKTSGSKRNYTRGLKSVKDIAAAASLCAFTATVITLAIVFWPYALQLVARSW